jgi:protein SCO1/2
MNIVSKQLHDPDVQFVFVSVDPFRDKLDTLAKYVPYFNPDFIGVTETSPGEIGKLTRQLGVLSMPVANGDDRENYLVEHSANLIIINPDGNWQAVMSAPHDPATIVKEFNLIKKHFEES